MTNCCVFLHYAEIESGRVLATELATCEQHRSSVLTLQQKLMSTNLVLKHSQLPLQISPGPN